MTTNILIETAIRFIRGEPKNAELSLLVAEAVPVLKVRVRDEILRRVRDALTEFTRQSSIWALRVPEKGRSKRVERLHLYRKDREHWVTNENHGVWFIWEDDGHSLGPGGWVGVEWPTAAESFVTKRDLERHFPSDSAWSEKGVRHEQHKEWFARAPFGREWREWPSLLAKSDTELREHARAVVDFMKRLTEAIDSAEATHRGEADPSAH